MDCAALKNQEAFNCIFSQRVGERIFGKDYKKREGLTFCVAEECLYNNRLKEIKVEETLMGYICKTKGKVGECQKRITWLDGYFTQPQL